MDSSRPINFGVLVPQGWRMDLVEIPDPIEKYETMTRVAQAADRAGYDSIWVFDHFHTDPTPEAGNDLRVLDDYGRAIPRIAYDQEPLQRFAQEVMPHFRS
jgi:hypothetical protein